MKKLFWTFCLLVWSLVGFAQEKTYQLSSHILDIQQGQPAAGVKISLSQLQPDGKKQKQHTHESQRYYRCKP